MISYLLSANYVKNKTIDQENFIDLCWIESQENWKSSEFDHLGICMKTVVKTIEGKLQKWIMQHFYELWERFVLSRKD